MKKGTLFRGLCATVAFVESVMIGASVAAFQFAPVINKFLDVETSKLVAKDEDDIVLPTYFKSDYAADVNNVTDEEKAKKDADVAAFVELEEEEGAVLLKNDDNALPLKSDEIKNVNLFGRSTVNPYRKSNSGGGSGGTNIDYLTALGERDFTWNTTLVDAYNADNSPKRSGSAHIIGESPKSIYTDSVTSSFANNGKVAIVMLSREAGESNDVSRNVVEGTSDLALDQNEKDMLSLIKQYKDHGTFTKVIALINTSNAMEVHWFDEYGIDAALWIGGPGNSTGFRGVADLLIGASNPSGRLVDTYATNSLSAPATVNFGEFTYTNRTEVGTGITENLTDAGYYVVHQEGIYVGYKYYETRYEDAILGQGNASANVGIWASEGNTWDYADEVAYPFGYGLSYTTFIQTMNEPVDNGDGTMTVTGQVKNEGSVAGKSVVELYAQTPYGEYEKTNNVEKSAVQLVGFTKTDVIQPQQTVDYEITFDKYFLASYDYTNAKTYIMSEGDYYLAVGDNAHDALNNILAAKGATGMVDHDGKSVTGNTAKAYKWTQDALDTETYRYTDTAEVTNQLDEADLNYYVDNGVTYLSRKDWQATYPVKAVEITASQKLIDKLDEDTYEKPADAPSVVNVPTGVNKGIKLADMYDVEYDDKLWTDFVQQMSLPELISITMEYGGIEAVESIAAPQTSNGDGPDGIAGNAYVNQSVAASSWSKDMLEKRGYYMGEDAILNHSAQQVWCPGIDTHRTPFGGRNFEYYSEDAILSYELTAVQTKMMESKGISVGPKHFFANDQETWRTGVSTFGNEQAFREIQLRAFEGAFVKGGATSVMTSFNRIGPIWVGHYSNVQDNILRGEWNFVGIVITDAAGTNSYMHTVEAIMNGTDMFCYTNGAAGDARTKDINDAIRNTDDGNIVLHLQEIAHRIFYTYSHTNLMNGLSPAFDVVPVTPTWQIAIVVVNCVIGAAVIGLGVTFAIFTYVKKDEDKEGKE